MNAPALQLDLTAITSGAAAAEQAAQTTSRRLGQLLRRWIGRSALDARECYLSQAADHGDLELRMRAWDANEQREAAFFASGSWMG